MKVEKSDLDGVLVVEPPTIFEDFRGEYVETYNQALYREHGIDADFVQDDLAVSRKHVLRGIHGDPETAKLVSCLFGNLYLVAVNNLSHSPEYRQWASFSISDKNRRQVYVPPGFGIGYLVMSDIGLFHYKQDTYYGGPTQFTLAWNDPEIGIWWPVTNPIISMRDAILDPDPTTSH